MGIGEKRPKKNWNVPLTAFEFKNFLGEDPQTPLQKNHTLDSSFKNPPTKLGITRFSDFLAKTHSDP